MDWSICKVRATRGAWCPATVRSRSTPATNGGSCHVEQRRSSREKSEGEGNTGYVIAGRGTLRRRQWTNAEGWLRAEPIESASQSLACEGLFPAPECPVELGPGFLHSVVCGLNLVQSGRVNRDSESFLHDCPVVLAQTFILRSQRAGIVLFARRSSHAAPPLDECLATPCTFDRAVLLRRMSSPNCVHEDGSGANRTAKRCWKGLVRRWKEHR